MKCFFWFFLYDLGELILFKQENMSNNTDAQTGSVATLTFLVFKKNVEEIPLGPIYQKS